MSSCPTCNISYPHDCDERERLRRASYNPFKQVFHKNTPLQRWAQAVSRCHINTNGMLFAEMWLPPLVKRKTTSVIENYQPLRYSS